MVFFRPFGLVCAVCVYGSVCMQERVVEIDLLAAKCGRDRKTTPNHFFTTNWFCYEFLCAFFLLFFTESFSEHYRQQWLLSIYEFFFCLFMFHVSHVFHCPVNSFSAFFIVNWIVWILNHFSVIFFSRFLPVSVSFDCWVHAAYTRK